MEEVTRVRDWHCRYVPMTDNDLTCWPCSPLSGRREEGGGIWRKKKSSSASNKNLAARRRPVTNE